MLDPAERSYDTIGTMQHREHVDLLRPAELSPGGVWADLGAGSGAFTLALRELVGPEAEIHAVDRDRRRLAELEREYRARFGNAEGLRLLPADFAHALELPPLDGALMANSLHFFKDLSQVLKHVGDLLKPGGVLLLVEYNVDRGNPWVPYPLSFETFRKLAPHAGYSEPRLLAKRPSGFLHEFYAAMASRNDI
jgi:ubiquinone/menaquinone biosynthesis C-methylase UbiE